VRGRVGRALRALLHVEGTPHRTAVAFAIGVFIAFSPLLGLHTGMALAIAFAFRLSRVAILTGAYLNNPWTLGPMYMTGTLLGCALLSVPPHGLDAIDWHLQGRAFYAALVETLRPYLWPYLIGNTVLGAVAAGAGYVVMRTVLERRRSSAATTQA
jgi:uncharacterized protein (DUF2062 family)